MRACFFCFFTFLVFNTVAHAFSYFFVFKFLCVTYRTLYSIIHDTWYDNKLQAPLKGSWHDALEPTLPKRRPHGGPVGPRAQAELVPVERTSVAKVATFGTTENEIPKKSEDRPKILFFLYHLDPCRLYGHCVGHGHNLSLVSDHSWAHPHLP